jgi:hypothetical protein
VLNEEGAGSVFYPAMTLVGSRSEHRTPPQSTRKQKLIQKHSQKMGRGSCRELLGQEAESMTDHDVEELRQHTRAMAWILVEMYEDHRRSSG